jgi:hypothetical protein
VVGEREQDPDVVQGEDALGHLTVQVDHTQQSSFQLERGDHDGAQPVQYDALRAEGSPSCVPVTTSGSRVRTDST